MAAGNHLEKGICALLVIAANIIAATCSVIISVLHMWRMFHCPWFKVQAIESRRRTSPIRLVRAVIIPAASDLGF